MSFNFLIKMNITIEKAESIREELGATHLIMFTADSEGGQNVATHGKTALQSQEAAAVGNELKKRLGWPGELCNSKPAPKRIDAKVVTKAARAHAKDQLGNEQFRTNKDAVLSIAEDFRAGVDWAIQEVGTNIVLRMHSDKDGVEAEHLSSFLLREAANAKWDEEHSQWVIQMHSAMEIFELGANWHLYKSQGYSFRKKVEGSQDNG